MHQIYFVWGSTSDSTGGAYSTPLDPLAECNEVYF